MVVAASGSQYDIEAGNLHATVTEVGAGLRVLHGDGRPLLDGYAADEPAPGAAGHLLIPWPNRIDGGRYEFRGSPRQLDITEPATGNALHGLVRWSPWRVVEHAGDSIELTHRLHAHPGYPFVLDLTVRYTLAESGLTVDTHAVNVGGSPAPYGNGAHPYLLASTGRVDGCLLTIPGETRVTVDSRGIPTGTQAVTGTVYDFRQPRRVGDLALDHAYTDLERDATGHARITLTDPDGRAAISLWADSSYRWLQAFTGDPLPQPQRRRRALAVEPMTCPPNGFATGEGVITLVPGQRYDSRWGITWARR